jgi:hypothetical protein
MIQHLKNIAAWLGPRLRSSFIWSCKKGWELLKWSFKKSWELLKILPWYAQATVAFFLIAQFDRNLAVGFAMIGSCFLAILIMIRGLNPKKGKKK